MNPAGTQPNQGLDSRQLHAGMTGGGLDFPPPFGGSKIPSLFGGETFFNLGIAGKLRPRYTGVLQTELIHPCNQPIALYMETSEAVRFAMGGLLHQGHGQIV